MTTHGLASLLLLGLLSGCSGGKTGDAAAEPAGKGGGGGGNGGGGGGGGGGRGPSTLMLSAADVATAKRGAIEAAVPVTGDLKPVEVIDVRARIEGDIDAVSVREGEHVNAGQLLASFEGSVQQSDRASAEADLASARTVQSTADWNSQQSAELFKAGAIAERELRTAQQDAAAARARVAAADARLRSTSISNRDTRVVSPANGIVEKRLVSSGEHVTRGTAMFTVVRGDVLELGAAVPGRLAGDVRVGQVVHFVADGRRFDGKVARISPTVDPSTRAMTVYVQIPNPSGTLKGNTFATGRVVSRTVSGAMIVPTSAVRQSPDSGPPFVYKIEGERLQRTTVNLGIVDEAGGLAEVLSGIEEGDKIVAGNVGTIGNGMKVQILDADRGGRGGGGRAAGGDSSARRAGDRATKGAS